MPVKTARNLYSRYWDGHLPVDPAKIARAMGVTVEFDADIGLAFGRFEIVDGHAYSYVNPDEIELRQRFTIAHELGHFALRHGDYFVDTAKEFGRLQLDFYERQANDFALELLIPAFAADIMIMKRNVMKVARLSELFKVSQTQRQPSSGD